MKAYIIYTMIWLAKLLNPKYWGVSTKLIYAQAVHETGRFTSDIFRESNNLFGMKLPSRRKTTATGENRGHATFKNWWASIWDYFLRQSYFNVSGSSDKSFIADTVDGVNGKFKYAEDPEYLKKWLQIYEEKHVLIKILAVFLILSVLTITHIILKKWLGIDTIKIVTGVFTRNTKKR